MGKFRKKPVEIEASQWFRNGDHPQDYAEAVEGLDSGVAVLFSPEQQILRDWEGQVVRRYRHPGITSTDSCAYCGWTFHNHGWIETMEGGHIVCPGDWVITGVQGERYPCKPDIFEQTYERVD